MPRRFTILLALFICTCLASCRHDLQDEENLSKEEKLVMISFEASCSEDRMQGDTRVSLNGLKFEWNKGDEIGVAENKTGGIIYKFTAQNGGGKAVFTGAAPEGFKAGKAFYPYSAVMSSSSGNNFRIHGIPSSIQKTSNGGICRSSLPLVTQFDDIYAGLTFHHLSAFLKVSVKGSDVREIKFHTDGLYPTGNGMPENDLKCHGALSIPEYSYVNIGCGSRVFNCAYRGEGYVILRPETGETFEPGEYLAVIPATDSKDPRTLKNLTVTYTKTDGTSWSTSSQKERKIMQGVIYSLPVDETLCTLDSDAVENAAVGRMIPAWKKGCFDIHFINTMSGEGYFMIFPDGTQMLVDCAGSLQNTGPVNSTTNEGIRKRWDPTKDSSYSYSTMFEEYIRQCMIWTGNNRIDYVLATHFHGDHYGNTSGRAVSERSSTYVQQSMSYILDVFSVGKVMDRGYPTYDYPYNMSAYYSHVKNWLATIDWHKANTGLDIERFKAGSDSQITLKYAASSYPSFSVRNIGVNGEVWTGTGTLTTNTFPTLQEIVCAAPPDPTSQENCPAENHNSAVMKLTYGKFDFWAGGDQQYNGMSYFSWKNSETTMAKACGEVDVMKADHHGTANTNGSGYTSKTGDRAVAMQYLNPKCWIVNSWVDGHPRKDTFEGVIKACPDIDIFITNTCDDQALYNGYSEHMKGGNGHIVVRVLPGGGKYYVYVLADRERNMKVKAVSGPYTSR